MRRARSRRARRRPAQAAQEVGRRHPALAGRLQLQDLAGRPRRSRPPALRRPPPLPAPARAAAHATPGRPAVQQRAARRCAATAPAPVRSSSAAGRDQSSARSAAVDLVGVGDPLRRPAPAAPAAPATPAPAAARPARAPRARTAPAVVVRADRDPLRGQDRARVELRPHLDHRHRRLGVAGHDRTLHRRRAPPARQRRGVQVDQRVRAQQRRRAGSGRTPPPPRPPLPAAAALASCGCVSCSPSSRAAAATGGGRSARPRPLGRSGWLTTAATSTPAARHQRRAAPRHRTATCRSSRRSPGAQAQLAQRLAAFLIPRRGRRSGCRPGGRSRAGSRAPRSPRRPCRPASPLASRPDTRTRRCRATGTCSSPPSSDRQPSVPTSVSSERSDQLGVDQHLSAHPHRVAR